ncbi:hypothetical protein JYU34_004303 [Plutella xylostella]|uniref:C2H2-type domain-containing protein n=1 Tax=Plutella xylostella TaxID=51655 RepID=A0ABQ7QXQ4_PLUXY|nr:hypothetical protein JYU34_004303 [Plutella xylostella]
MDINTTTCRGCLSIDRKLSLLKEELRNLFLGLLEDENSCKEPLYLCWECVALINKFIKFKRRVKTINKSLSNIKSHTLSHLCISDTECITNSPAVTHPDGVVTQTARQPIAIKHETLENLVTLDTCFVDYVKSGSVSDDEDFKADIHNDYNDNDKKYGKVNTPENFDDSDDEPLSLKPKNVLQDTGIIKVDDNHKKRKRKRDNEGTKEVTKTVKKRSRPENTGVVVNKKASRKLEQLNMNNGQVELILLSWDEVEEERRKGLMNEAFTRLEYKCFNCILGFNHRSKLENHMKKHDQSAGSELCHVCKVVCKDTRALEAHTRRHRIRWRCALCGAAWSRAAVAADHVARAHGSAPPTHACSACDHVAPTFGKLRVHMKVHNERQKCEICGKSFTDRSSLRTHLFIHKGEKEYECPRCHKLFLFKKAMEVHLVTHLESAHLYCHECDLTFKNRMSYYGHMKYNLKHIDPAKLKYECQLCDKKFAKAARLEEHRAAIHLKVTPHRCTLPGCNFACASRPVLRTHVRMVHRNGKAIRNHVCDICGKAYTTKKSLEGHMRAHRGSRPLRCAQCPAAFGYEAALYNHCKRVHRKGKTSKSGAATMAAAGPSWDVPLDISLTVAAPADNS